jgi:hypothetical protein
MDLRTAYMIFVMVYGGTLIGLFCTGCILVLYMHLLDHLLPGHPVYCETRNE